MPPKITPDHLGRGAVVYIRQSTPGQVAEHTESQRRQSTVHPAATGSGSPNTVTVSPALSVTTGFKRQRWGLDVRGGDRA